MPSKLTSALMEMNPTNPSRRDGGKDEYSTTALIK